MNIAKKIAVSAAALSIACVECMAAVSVTASRDYVDRKTSVSVVTNDNVEGYRIGSNSNFTFATHAELTGLINSIPGMIQEMAPAPGNYQVVSNAAMSAVQAENGSATNLQVHGNLLIWDEGGEVPLVIHPYYNGSYFWFENGRRGVDVRRINVDFPTDRAMADVAFRHEVSSAADASTNYTDTATNGLPTVEYVDDAIDRLAAYYITANAKGDAFQTLHALTNAAAYWSGGEPRTPTRNDYAVVLADESHGGAEWRYVYAVAGGEINGQWEAQYPIETNDYDALANLPQINGVELGGTNNTAQGLGLIGAGGGMITNLELYSTLGDIGVRDSFGSYLTLRADVFGVYLAHKLGNDSTVYNLFPPLKTGFLATVSDVEGKQDALTPAQTNAVNSGVTAAKVATWDGNAAQITGKLNKSGDTMTGPLTEKNGLILGKEMGNDFDGFMVDDSGNALMTSHAGGKSTIDAIITAVQGFENKADRAPNPTVDNLASLDASGNPTDSGIGKASVATKEDVSSAINTTVTPAYIRERLGVSLYVGEDGGIYIHIEGE